MKIDEDSINSAFDELLQIFEELAEAEDVVNELKTELESYKPVSPKRAEVQLKLDEAERNRIKIARKYVKAQMKVDRIKTLMRLV